MIDQKTNRPPLLQIGVGNIFASMVISGLIIGYFVDQWLEMTPIFMLSFAVLGFIGGMKKVHGILKYEHKENSESDNS